MTSPPFFFNCKNCGQDEEFMDYPEWWVCGRCFMKNTYHWVLFLKWISCKPLTNRELNEMNRPLIGIDWNKKPQSYEKRLNIKEVKK